MKTAQDVIEAIDQEIAELEHAASGPCIEALVEPVDRETYRDAMHRAAGLRAVKRLREKLIDQVEANGSRAKRRKKAAR